MAACPSISEGNLLLWRERRPAHSAEPTKPLEFAGVFSGRELTRKDRRLSSELAPIDQLLGGGIVRGRISEIVGPAGAGKTSLAACFTASVTRHGETIAWIDAGGAFDPATIAAAGVDLTRVLWVGFNGKPLQMVEPGSRKGPSVKFLRAAELVLEAGGLGLVIIDFGTYTRAISPSAALRVARLAERTGAAVLVLAMHRMCGTFAAQCLTLNCDRPRFSRAALGAPTLFDGLIAQARVTRNKLGGVGAHASWRALVDLHQKSEPTDSGWNTDFSLTTKAAGHSRLCGESASDA